jgi:hypothetical protein
LYFYFKTNSIIVRSDSEKKNIFAYDQAGVSVLSRDSSLFSTRRNDFFNPFVGIAYHVSKRDADKGKSRFARENSPSGKRASCKELYKRNR